MKRTQPEIKKRKLGQKLTYRVLGVVLIAFFLILVIVLRTAYSYYRQQEINMQRFQVERSAAQVKTLQTTVENMGKQIIFDDVVLRCLNMEEDSTGKYLYAVLSARRKLANYSFIIDGVREIMIYTSDGRTLSSKEIKQSFKPEENLWYQEFLASGRKSGFSVVHDSEPSSYNYTVDVVSYIMSYYSVGDTSEELGKLIINIDVSKFQEYMVPVTGMVEAYTLFDSQQNPLITDGKLQFSYDEIAGADENGLVKASLGDVGIISSDMNDHWKLAVEISGDNLIRSTIGSFIWLPVVYVLIFVVLIIILRHSIRRIVTPIGQLSEAALEVGGGNFNTSVRIKTGDELEVLADVFNRMVIDIQELMEKSVEHEKAIGHMRIENLMLQIDPHFIYNTLNSIVYMAWMNETPQIANFANAFISLLQSTLDVKASIYNTVGKEIANVENYLHLQMYRYADKFIYKIQCDEELKDCQILNVMLQPAVENAIFHGIAPKEGTGRLMLSVWRESENLKICVEDDGIGMSEETLSELMKPEHIQKGGIRKIGVANVRERIRNIFGEPYQLVIESEVGVGTRVIMTVPYKKQSEGQE